MLAMSVIGIVVGAAFGIANRSIAAGQDAQERTEALKIAETQLELFKSQFPLSVSLRNRTDAQPFCFDITQGVSTLADDSDAACTNIGPNGTSGLYSVKIVPPSAVSATKSYSIEVTWTRLAASTTETAQNTLRLYYKPGEI
jgi:type II secretory pathway pseudopilin PulG